MVDILFCAHGRPEFTRASLKALADNTDLSRNLLCLYTDGLDFKCSRNPEYQGPELPVCFRLSKYGGPVACMNHFLSATSSEFVAKIDNDTIVPPGWLDACLDMMKMAPGCDLLGIEAWSPEYSLMEPIESDWRCRGLRIARNIGGIGLFRRRAFERYGLPTPNTQDGRYGFTEWQWAHPEMVKVFIDPPLPVFLLDHLPFEPWLSLSAKYEREGIQRPHGWLYDAEKHKDLWKWWTQ